MPNLSRGYLFMKVAKRFLTAAGSRLCRLRQCVIAIASLLTFSTSVLGLTGWMTGTQPDATCEDTAPGLSQHFVFITN